MSKPRTRSFAAFVLATAVGSIAIGASPPNTEAILENSPVSCFYVLMHAYRQEMNICEMPLDQSREERFSRMSDTIENYIRNNARLDPEAIITNSRGTAERAAASFPARTLDLSNDILGPMESAV